MHRSELCSSSLLLAVTTFRTTYHTIKREESLVRKHDRCSCTRSADRSRTRRFFANRCTTCSVVVAQAEARCALFKSQSSICNDCLRVLFNIALIFSFRNFLPAAGLRQRLIVSQRYIALLGDLSKSEQG